jgi:hypothetical protein
MRQAKRRGSLKELRQVIQVSLPLVRSSTDIFSVLTLRRTVFDSRFDSRLPKVFRESHVHPSLVHFLLCGAYLESRSFSSQATLNSKLQRGALWPLFRQNQLSLFGSPQPVQLSFVFNPNFVTAPTQLTKRYDLREAGQSVCILAPFPYPIIALPIRFGNVFEFLRGKLLRGLASCFFVHCFFLKTFGLANSLTFHLETQPPDLFSHKILRKSYPKNLALHLK